jgi:hypothetical protein
MPNYYTIKKFAKYATLLHVVAQKDFKKILCDVIFDKPNFRNIYFAFYLSK